ncbi:hypothetical protein KAI87_07945 [Myxococcota bacterium]|nr:hypothetical protein [Myxococcota bacterium]
MDFKKPKRRIKPDTFYSDYLPKLWSQFFSDLNPGWEFSVLLRIHDEDQNHFETLIRIDGAQLRLAQSSEEVADFTSTMQLEAWQSAIGLILPLTLSMLNQKWAEIETFSKRWLSAHNAGEDIGKMSDTGGKVTLEYIDDAGDLAAYDIVFGDGSAAAQKSTVIRIEHDDLVGLLRGGKKLSALLKGRSEISGNIGYLLQLVTILEDLG